MNKRGFTIGLGAGLLIASTLSLAGYLSVLSDYDSFENPGGNGAELTAQVLENEESNPNEEEITQETDAPDVVENTPAEIENKSSEPVEIAKNDEVETTEEPVAEQEKAEEKPEEKEEKDGEKAEEPDVQKPTGAEQPLVTQAPEAKPQPQIPTAQTPQQQAPAAQQQQASATQPQTQQPQAPATQPQTQQPQAPATQPQPAPAQAENGPVKVTISDNATNKEIAHAMSSQGIIDNAKEFENYLDKTGLYVQYKPGEYEFDKNASFDEIVEDMMKGN